MDFIINSACLLVNNFVLPPKIDSSVLMVKHSDKSDEKLDKPKKIYSKTGKRKLGMDQKSQETKVGKILARLLPNFKFETRVRSLDWLFNDKTGMALELDYYCKALNLAVEVQGQHHYQYLPFFHASYTEFEKQQERDKRKANLCYANGVNLICISWKMTDEEIEAHLLVKIAEWIKKTEETI